MPDVDAHNLPLLLSTFIGREQEIAEVTQWLATHRLVTLTGAGRLRQDTPSCADGEKLAAEVCRWCLAD